MPAGVKSGNCSHLVVLPEEVPVIIKLNVSSAVPPV